MIVERAYQAANFGDSIHIAITLYTKRKEHPNDVKLISEVDIPMASQRTLEYHLGDITAYVAGNRRDFTALLIGREEAFGPALEIIERITERKLTEKSKETSEMKPTKRNYQVNASIYLALDESVISDEELLNQGFQRERMDEGGIRLEYEDKTLISMQGSFAHKGEILTNVEITSSDECIFPAAVSKLEQLTGLELKETEK